jgi:hypothetical protein
VQFPIDRARAHLAATRSRAGHLATAAGTAAATAGLFTADYTGDALLGTLAATGAGLVFLPTGRASGHQKYTAAVLYTAPGVSLTAVLLAERIVSGTHWGEALAVAVWSAGVWFLRPAWAARRMLVPPVPAPAPAADVELPQQAAAGAHPAALWWASKVAVEGGPAAATVLEDVERTGPESLTAIIRSIVPGVPVPDISVRHLSALMDVPEDLITVGPVRGRGASVRQLTVGHPPADNDPVAVWTQRIAPLAMPGSTITGITFGHMTKENV